MKRILSMTTFKRGDIILIPFPLSDQEGIKKRPAVIVSSDSYNHVSGDVVIMAVTSKLGKNGLHRRVLDKEMEKSRIVKTLNS